MSPNQLRELHGAIEAKLRGEKIQCKPINGEGKWVDCDEIDTMDKWLYRAKPDLDELDQSAFEKWCHENHASPSANDWARSVWIGALEYARSKPLA